MPIIRRRSVISNHGALYVPGGAAWSPLDLSGLIGWYKADVGITGSSPVTGWADQSGAGNNLVVRSGYIGPTYNATGMGGKESIDFIGGFNDSMGQNSDSVALGTGNTSSIFALVSVASGSAGNTLAAITGNGQATTPATGANSWALITDASEPAVHAYHNTNVDPATGKAFTLNTVTRVGYIYDGTNGTPYVDNSAGNTTARNFSFTTPGRLIVGGGNYIGKVREVIICTSALSSGDRNSLDTYLVSRS